MLPLRSTCSRWTRVRDAIALFEINHWPGPPTTQKVSGPLTQNYFALVNLCNTKSLMRTERKSFFCYIVQLFASEEDPQGLKMDAKISLLGGPEESFCVGGGPGPIHRGGGDSALFRPSIEIFRFMGHLRLPSVRLSLKVLRAWKAQPCRAAFSRFR